MKTYKRVSIKFLISLTILTLVISCTKKIDLPTVTTADISDITMTTALSGGEVTDDGGSMIVARGICWNTQKNPTTSNFNALAGGDLGPFSCTLTSLTPGTTYYVKAYAINSKGTAYGNEVTFTTSQIVAATLTTSPVLAITSTSAISGGNITDNGGGNITARGVCWSTAANPTTADNKTSDGTGSGTFTSNLTGLLPGTTYHIRAYATNSAGTAYGNDLTFTTVAVAPTVTTAAVSAITQTTATSGGNITANGGAEITARGVCWGTTSGPTIAGSHTTDGTGSGAFTSNITGLAPNTTYYVRAYVTNSIGTGYGNEITFKTSEVTLPTLTTITASTITPTTATSGGNITADGGGEITSRGVCWGTTANPTIAGNRTTDGTGSGTFTSNLTGLLPGTTYHIRAYATNSAGTAYGNDLTFTTVAVAPTVTTTAVSAISQTTATSGGNITANGGAEITARGVCWGTTSGPTIAGSHTTDGTGSGTFTSSVTGLSPGTFYYLRAYATNSAGTAYGNELTFTANSVILATVTTSPVTSITSTTAESGGNITSSGGGAITDRGICWSTSANPTIANSHTTAGSGTGTFTASLTGLTGNTIYYVRAYATNSAGTAYGNQLSFESAHMPPTVSTTAASNITSSSAISGGVVLLHDGENVTVKGVCWNTTGNPTIADPHTTDGAGLGSFTSYLTGLTPGITYYVRAFASNSIGLSYGNQITFTAYLSSVTDIDGNIYNVIRIGDQYWMKENLRTTKLNDGSQIRYITSAIWNSPIDGYCWYNDDESTYKELFGALYAFEKVVDTDKLCPTGWHVPNYDDWITLFNFLGGDMVAGGKMKEAGTLHWQSPNVGATNESGFTSLPAGGCYLNYAYSGIYINTSYWISGTHYDPTQLSDRGWHVSISTNSADCKLWVDYRHRVSCSVRCIKD